MAGCWRGKPEHRNAVTGVESGITEAERDALGMMTEGEKVDVLDTKSVTLRDLPNVTKPLHRSDSAAGLECCRDRYSQPDKVNVLHSGLTLCAESDTETTSLD